MLASRLPAECRESGSRVSKVRVAISPWDADQRDVTLSSVQSHCLRAGPCLVPVFPRCYAAQLHNDRCSFSTLRGQDLERQARCLGKGWIVSAIAFATPLGDLIPALGRMTRVLCLLGFLAARLGCFCESDCAKLLVTLHGVPIECQVAQEVRGSDDAGGLQEFAVVRAAASRGQGCSRVGNGWDCQPGVKGCCPGVFRGVSAPHCQN